MASANKAPPHTAAQGAHPPPGVTQGAPPQGGHVAEIKVDIKNALMSKEMQQVAVEQARHIVIEAPKKSKENPEKEIAAYLKKEFDKAYTPTWHCVVGKTFGSHVTHEKEHFIFFTVGIYQILLFKSG